MTVYYEKFYHAQNYRKNVNNQNVKPKSYILSNKILLKNQYIKTKQNRKLKIKFF